MTSLAPQPLFQSTPAPYIGPASYDSVLASFASVGEGVWVPARFAKQASIEIEGTFSVLSLQLIGSNALNSPPNLYTLTIGGTVTTGDAVTMAFANPNLAAGSESVSYTTIGGDTTATIATALAAAINADAKLQALGIVATVSASVVTVSYPSEGPSGQEGGSPTEPPPQNTTIITATVGGSATETVTIANASVGASVGAAITAKGVTAIATMTGWIKAVVNTFTGSALTAGYHGVA